MFTDGDLRRLKDSLEAGCILTDTDMNLPALLARLEAAERVIKAYGENLYLGSVKQQKILKKWLGSKGDGRAG